MPHGHPDYGAGAPATTIYTIQDMAELAARLGSIITFDRRGNVIWFDDFENEPRGRYAFGGAAGYSLDWCSERSRNGGFCAKITSGPGSPFSGWGTKKLPYPVLGKLGLEASFDLDTNASEFFILFDLYDGTIIHRAGLRFTPSSGEVAYEDSNAAWVALATSLFYPFSGLLFNTVKLVADFENDLYVRVIVNNQTYDLSAQGLFTEANGGTAYLHITYMVYGSSGKSAVCYLDDAIVTQNEP